MKINFHSQFAPKFLEDFVESFWMIHNTSKDKQDIIVLPDGRVDLFLTKSADFDFRIVLLGLDTQPIAKVLSGETITFVISFKPLAIESIFNRSIADIKNSACILPENFWGFKVSDLEHFESFCEKAIKILAEHTVEPLNPEKKKLFDLIYQYNGDIKISELAEQINWNERRINRYFNQQYGMSLKQYSNIIRFKSSFRQLKKGMLYPEGDFTDQSHFIKEIKKKSGVTPKELYINESDKFIQIAVQRT